MLAAGVLVAITLGSRADRKARPPAAGPGPGTAAKLSAPSGGLQAPSGAVRFGALPPDTSWSFFARERVRAPERASRVEAWIESPGVFAWVDVGEDGSFAVRGLPADPCRLTFRAEIDGERRVRKVDATPGDELVIDLAAD